MLRDLTIAIALVGAIITAGVAASGQLTQLTAWAPAGSAVHAVLTLIGR